MELSSKYNETLNPSIWDGDTLKSEVLEKLQAIAVAFVDFLEVNDLFVEDVILTGSNANYNWTEQSDIDLHIVVDLDRIRSSCPDLADDFFQGKKTLWNEHHNITIYKQPVELYVQDSNEIHVATGVYSIQNGKWIVKPSYKKPTVDDVSVQLKSDQFKYEIDKLIDGKGNQEAVDNLKDKIRTYRKAGLKKNGEWSTENLTFKELRNSGHLEKLSDYARSSKSETLSLK